MAPRLILPTSDARFIVAVGSDPAARGGDDTEVIAYDDKEASFRFARIAFEGSGNGARLERDPPSCAGCHGRPSRPNWDPYPNWPGVYGSADNSLHTAAGSALLAAERDAYATLVRAVVRGSPESGARLALLPWDRAATLVERDPDAAFEELKQRNTRFTLALSALNFTRLRAEVERRAAAPDVPAEWRANIHAWMAQAVNRPRDVFHPRGPRLVPHDAAFAARVAALAPSRRSEVRSRVEAHMDDIVARHNASAFSRVLLAGRGDLRTFGEKPWPDDRDVDAIAALTTLARVLGVDTEVWSMGVTSSTRRVGADVFSTGFHGIRDFVAPRTGPYAFPLARERGEE